MKKQGLEEIQYPKPTLNQPLTGHENIWKTKVFVRFMIYEEDMILYEIYRKCMKTYSILRRLRVG